MRTFQRALQISSISIKYLVFYKFTRHRQESLGMRLRFSCQELGLVFIKIGQILSTRYDLLSREDCTELQKLLDTVPTIPYDQIKKIFLEDFNTTPEILFQNWNPVPIASASVAQVYRAYIPKYGDVAVKVRRPEIAKNIGTDLRVLRSLGKVAQIFSPNLRQINLNEVFSQIESWLMAEADFKNEANNLEEIKQFYKGTAQKIIGKYTNDLVFPSVYREFSSAQIITMEFIKGVPVQQFKTILRNPEYDVLASLKAFAGAMMRVWIHGSEYIFQGDPHPSNLLILPHGKLAVLDFGLLARLSKKDGEETRDLLLAVYAQDLESTIRASLEMCRASYDKFAHLIREDIKKYLETAKDSPMGFWFIGLIKVFIKHRVPLTYQTVLIGRMQTIVEGLFETVMPGVSTLDVFGTELKRGLWQQIISKFLKTDFSPILSTLGEQAQKSPRLIAGMIEKYFNNPAQAIRDLKEIIRA